MRLADTLTWRTLDPAVIGEVPLRTAAPALQWTRRQPSLFVRPAGIGRDPSAPDAGPAKPYKGFKTQQILDLAARPDGVTAPEVIKHAGVTHAGASARLAELSKAGRLLRVKLFGMLQRYFVDAAVGAAWQERQVPRRPRSSVNPELLRTAHGHRTLLALELAGRPEGLTVAQFVEATRGEQRSCGAKLCELVRVGRLVVLPRETGRRARYFCEQAQVDAWLQALYAARGTPHAGPDCADAVRSPPHAAAPVPQSAPTPQRSPLLTDARAPMPRLDRGKGSAPPPLPGSEVNRKPRKTHNPEPIRPVLFEPVKPSGDAIVPDSVRRIVLPPLRFDPRYQVDPDVKVEGGFAAMGIGRYAR